MPAIRACPLILVQLWVARCVQLAGHLRRRWVIGHRMDSGGDSGPSLPLLASKPSHASRVLLYCRLRESSNITADRRNTNASMDRTAIRFARRASLPGMLLQSAGDVAGRTPTPSPIRRTASAPPRRRYACSWIAVNPIGYFDKNIYRST